MNKSFIETAYKNLNRIVSINDTDLKFEDVQGYISELDLNLDNPWEDSITIQNYKTKFEDLFNTITAQSEAMKRNAASYDIAAGSFLGNGNISGDVLQDSLSNIEAYLNYSSMGIMVSPEEGITLTNTIPYGNGILGQVKL